MNTKDAITAAEAMQSVSAQLERFFARVLDNQPIPGRDDLDEQERLSALDQACYAEQVDPELLRESRETFVECARPLNPVRIDTGD